MMDRVSSAPSQFLFSHISSALSFFGVSLTFHSLLPRLVAPPLFLNLRFIPSFEHTVPSFKILESSIQLKQDVLEETVSPARAPSSSGHRGPIFPR